MLKNKVVVITGGAGLLGSQFCKSISKNNGIAIIADINEEKGIKLLNEIGRKENSFYYLDITSKDSIQNLINKVSYKYGKIDAIVNSAYPRNKNWGQDFFEVTYESFCENLSIHLGGYFLCSKLFSKYLIDNQLTGNIINIASIYGVIAPRFDIYDNTNMTTPIEYAAIKSSVVHLTKYLAKYFKGHNIRVNCISPGGILDNQPQQFLKKYKSYCTNKGMLYPNDITGTLLFLLSDLSEFINGQNICVDDGFTL